MMQPKRNIRKRQKGRNRGMVYRSVDFGEFGLKATTAGYITARQIEAARIVIARTVKRTGKLWIRIFPDYPRTKKPLEVRQGKGKGPIDHWEAIIKPGTMLFEIEGVPEDLARKAFRLASAKLPINTDFVEETVM